MSLKEERNDYENDENIVELIDEDGNTLTDDEGNAIYEFELRWPYTNSTYGFKSKHKLLPIPLTEIEVNPNMEQNEGW